MSVSNSDGIDGPSADDLHSAAVIGIDDARLRVSRGAELGPPRPIVRMVQELDIFQPWTRLQDLDDLRTALLPEGGLPDAVVESTMAVRPMVVVEVQIEADAAETARCRQQFSDVCLDRVSEEWSRRHAMMVQCSRSRQPLPCSRDTDAARGGRDAGKLV